MKANDVTVTDARMKQALSRGVTSVVNEKVPQMISRANDDVSIRTGVVTKVYPYIDKVEVKLDHNDEKIICKILHRYGGALLDLYTPSSDRREFCNKLKEPCYIPRGKLHCVVVNIHDADSNEYLLLGYYSNEELVGLNPAAPGNIKLCTITGTNQYWIKFGAAGLDIRAEKKPSMKLGNRERDMVPVDYADSTDVYTKEECYNKTECYNKQEVYTKEEVDELIAEKVAEAIVELQGEDTNDTTS